VLWLWSHSWKLQARKAARWPALERGAPKVGAVEVEQEARQLLH
jgi:hypothetical protein